MLPENAGMEKISFAKNCPPLEPKKPKTIEVKVAQDKCRIVAVISDVLVFFWYGILDKMGHFTWIFMYSFHFLVLVRL